MSDLETWSEQVRQELGLADPLDVPALLDLARDVAHAVARPAAPVTSYLLGLAVGRGDDPAVAAERIRALAAAWPTEPT